MHARILKVLSYPKTHAEMGACAPLEWLSWNATAPATVKPVDGNGAVRRLLLGIPDFTVNVWVKTASSTRMYMVSFRDSCIDGQVCSSLLNIDLNPLPRSALHVVSFLVVFSDLLNRLQGL